MSDTWKGLFLACGAQGPGKQTQGVSGPAVASMPCGQVTGSRQERAGRESWRVGCGLPSCRWHCRLAGREGEGTGRCLGSPEFPLWAPDRVITGPGLVKGRGGASWGGSEGGRPAR